MLQKKLALLLILFIPLSILSMEKMGEATDSTESLSLIEMLPVEVKLIILEYILGINPSLIQAKDIVEALVTAKDIILENGTNFALSCRLFNVLKNRFFLLTKKNLKNYLALYWAAEYLSKSKIELDEMLEKLFDKIDTTNGEIEAAKLLCAGANPNAYIKYRETELHYQPPYPITVSKEMHGYLLHFIIETYKERDKTALLPFLVLYNVDINRKDVAGNTALILSSKNNLSNVVKYLLKRKDIDLNAKSNEGYSALDYAQARGHKTIIAMILDAKAN